MKLDGRRDLRSCLSPPPYQMLPHDCCSETCPLLTITSLLLCSCAPTNGPSSTWSQSASEHPSHHTTSAHTHAHPIVPCLSLAWGASIICPSFSKFKSHQSHPHPPCSTLLLCPWNFPGKNARAGGICYSTEHPPSQGSLPCPHTLPILFPLGRVRFPGLLSAP